MGLPLSIHRKSYWPVTLAAVAGTAADFMDVSVVITITDRRKQENYGSCGRYMYSLCMVPGTCTLYLVSLNTIVQ